VEAEAGWQRCVQQRQRAGQGTSGCNRNVGTTTKELRGHKQGSGDEASSTSEKSTRDEPRNQIHLRGDPI
jgi:hypothetical protein